MKRCAQKKRQGCELTENKVENSCEECSAAFIQNDVRIPRNSLYLVSDKFPPLFLCLQSHAFVYTTSHQVKQIKKTKQFKAKQKTEK